MCFSGLAQAWHNGNRTVQPNNGQKDREEKI